MPEPLKPIPLHFWKSAIGREPVREWLNGLPREDQRTIGRDLGKVQFGWPIGMPICRPLGGGLWKCAFIKKTQKTPAEDLALARQRLKEMRS